MSDTTVTETPAKKKSILTNAIEDAKARVHNATAPVDETAPKKINNKITFGIGLVTGAAALYAALRIFTGTDEADIDGEDIETELDD